MGDETEEVCRRLHGVVAATERGAWLFSLHRRQLEGVPVAELLREVNEFTT